MEQRMLIAALKCFAAAVLIAAGMHLNPWIIRRRRLLSMLAFDMSEAAKRGDPLPGLMRILAGRGRWAFGRALLRLAERMEKGGRISETLAQERALFPAQAIGIVAAGEAAGNLPDALAEVSRWAWEDLSRRLKVIIFAWYPLFLVLFLLAASAAADSNRFYMETLSYNEEYGGLDVAGNLSFSSAFVSFHFAWPAILFGFIPLALVLLDAVVRLSEKQSKGTKRILDSMRSRTPVLGMFIRLAACERLCRILGIAIRRGAPLPEVLRKAGPALGNSVLGDEVVEMAAEIEKGRNLADAFGSAKAMTSRFVWHAGVAARSIDQGRAFIDLAERIAGQRTRLVRYTGWTAAVSTVVLVGFYVASWEYFVFSILKGYLKAVS